MADDDNKNHVDRAAPPPHTSTPDLSRQSQSQSQSRMTFNASVFGGASAYAYASTGETASGHHHHHHHAQHQHHRHADSHQRPLAMLHSTPPPTVKEQQYGEPSRPDLGPHLIPTVEKDVDDVTSPPSARARLHARQESTTLTTLSRLFAVQAAPSPEHSRQPSYVMPSRYPSSYNRPSYSAQTAALPDHLYSRGLLSGKHSDITVHAFARPYKLHRLILDRAPFFASALSEAWLEANAKDITVHPEDIDSSITQAAFELALKRLYGASSVSEEDQNPVGLFATACWLEMQDLVDSSIESMLRQMTPETLSPLIKLVTSKYYGRAGDKVLASAKSMLCRDGWRMPLKFWDGIPGDIIREIVGGDGFFIDGEWDRFVLAKRLLDRRLRQQAIAAGLVEPSHPRKVAKVPEAAGLTAIRFDSVYRRSDACAGRGVPESLQKWITPYTSIEVEPILVLLDEGIHYVHLDFEQLQYIRNAKDCLGLPVLSDKVVSSALWQQMELRQKVMNAREIELELGLSVECAEDAALNTNRDTTMSIHESSMSKGKRKVGASDEAAEDMIDSGSWDGNGKPRKFWIPSSDCNIVMGGNSEPIIATSNNTTLQRRASRLSATIQSEDVQWVADFAAATSQPRVPPQMPSADSTHSPEPVTISWTAFPPFRFSCEFPNPRHLKEKKRVYSRTVFYAGSLWNIYIQKVASSRSKQLGVYLHRAKERETEEVVAGTAGLAQGSVDERIGQLEREMIMRSERRERRQRRRTTIASDGTDGNDIDSGDSAGIDEDHPLSNERATHLNSRATMMQNLLSRRHHKDMDILSSSPPSAEPTSKGHSNSTQDAQSPGWDSEADDTEVERLSAASSRLHIPTLPPYVDVRPTIKTYFKIYSPSRGGRMLSVYESAPDKFNFSQSWGWKSSTLMLDEALLGDDDDPNKDDGNETVSERDGASRTMKGRRDGKLRFMVVIGNI
ncbi:hypothetical protein AC579_7667 [Pseudocercospora musae]|uniref:BTB domain-containing protein n=1 Tax=Pseudocercospora musae TaxID=113226 RepID=A0A139I2J3_9PEZI|nr:hypothetical protein AC579_7667 [Pseudocercospora musae]